jgi:hypothetical protein
MSGSLRSEDAGVKTGSEEGFGAKLGELNAEDR